MSNRPPPSNDELEVAEAKNPLTDLLYDYTAQAMTSRIGSYVYHRFDACLAIVEKTAKWSLPQSPSPSEEDTSKMNISPPPLVRPLPWILFLPALIALRLLRVSLSFAALLIGKQPVYPITMVSFLQARRRKLRALKYRGQKIQRMKRAERDSEEKAEAQIASSWLQRITSPLRYIICLRAVRPGTSIHEQEHHHHHHHHHRQGRSRELPGDEKANQDGTSRAKARDEAAGRRKRNAHERDADDSDSSVGESSVQEQLDKYANEDGDSTFHASDFPSSDSDSFVTESDESHSEQHADPAEQNDCKKLKKDSNGHATTAPEKQQIGSQKPEEPQNKSSLNAVDNGAKADYNAKPATPAAEPSRAPAAENGNNVPKKDSKEPQTDSSQKPEKATPESSENIDNKPPNQSNSTKVQPPEDNAKTDGTNASKNQSPAATKEAKTHTQQRNKSNQQQQHQQNHNNQQQQQQHHPQQQQQHHPHQQQKQQQQHHQQPQQHSTTVNGGGGGGGGGAKKHKKPHHPNAQQQHQHQQQQHQQQQQQYH